jgi:tRNA (guanine-N7-)-methyltransferase
MEQSACIDAPESAGLIARWIEEDRPIEIDLGCGKGTFIVGLAAAHPERCFVGVERQKGRVARSQRKVDAQGLTNACFATGFILESLETLFRPASAEVVHVMFPDPWPKRRHHVRRLVNRKFMDAAARVIRPGGSLRFMTDDEPYFRAAMRVFLADERFEKADWDDGREYPKTDFQRVFEAMGRPFYFAAWRRLVDTASS